jgi:hypothetical protein
VAACLAERVGRGSLMGGNIVDSPLIHPRCGVLSSHGGVLVAGVGVVGTLLGPEGTGPTPHPVTGGWGSLRLHGRGARRLAGCCCLWRCGHCLPYRSCFLVVFVSWVSLCVGGSGVWGWPGWGVGGGRGCLGGRGVFVNWIVDASI